MDLPPLDYVRGCGRKFENPTRERCASAVRNSFSDTGGDAATTAAKAAAATPADAAEVSAVERPATAHGVRPRRKWDCESAGCCSDTS